MRASRSASTSSSLGMRDSGMSSKRPRPVPRSCSWPGWSPDGANVSQVLVARGPLCLVRSDGEMPTGEPTVALEEVAQALENAVVVLLHGRDVTADGAVVAGTGQRAPGARDLLLELDHADISFGLVVVKGCVEIVGETQDVGPLGVEALEEVGRGLIHPGAFTHLGCGVGGPALGDELTVADADRVQRGRVQSVRPGALCGFDGTFGLDQEVDHLVGPALGPTHAHP